MTATMGTIIPAYADAERYARGETIFAAVVRHGAAAITEAMIYASEKLLRDGSGKGLTLDVIDTLEEALREL